MVVLFYFMIVLFIVACAIIGIQNKKYKKEKDKLEEKVSRELRKTDIMEDVVRREKPELLTTIYAMKAKNVSDSDTEK